MTKHLIVFFILIAAIVCSSTQQEGSANDLVLIAGTQKSGTTVLAAYLSAHPNITFPARKKELHFFDKNANYEKGIQNYLEEFDTKQDTMMIGEATPYYIASPTSCQRIAKHFPTVKMIILLRHPALRAYSEFQMKVRRVKEQEEFFELINAQSDKVISCLLSNPANYPKLAKCLPIQISRHSRFPKFSKALKAMMKVYGEWQKVVNTCFDIPFGDEALPDNTNDLTHQTPPLNEHLPLYQQSTVSSFTNNTAASYLVESVINIIPAGYHQKTNVGASSFDNNKQNKKKNIQQKAYALNGRKCWQYFQAGFEQVKSLHRAFRKEIEDFQQCSLQYVSSESVLHETIETLDTVAKQCIKIRGGISTQYFFRSMYALQLHRCFQHIDRNQFLIIPSEDLRQQPATVLRQVLQFLQLPIKQQWIESIVQENTHSLVTSQFSAFEKATGWKLLGDYESIPVSMEEYLNAFYLPHNALLFEMLGQTFTDRW